MKRFLRQTSVLREPASNRFENIYSSIDLPAADEFECSSEEVHQVCSEFRDIGREDWTS